MNLQDDHSNDDNYVCRRSIIFNFHKNLLSTIYYAVTADTRIISRIQISCPRRARLRIAAAKILACTYLHTFEERMNPNTKSSQSLSIFSFTSVALFAWSSSDDASSTKPPPTRTTMQSNCRKNEMFRK